MRSAASERNRRPAPRLGRARLVSCFAALIVAGAALALGTGSPHAAVSSTIYANFDADGNITMKFADGTPIGAPTAPGTVIPAGTYTIVLNNNSLDDLGNPHQFHLFGPGVNLTPGQAVQVTWTATFQPASTYVYQDDLNPTTSREVFGTPGSGATATSIPASTTTPTTPVPEPTTTGGKNVIGNPIKTVPFRGTLLGTVSAAGKLTLTSKGKNVSSLKTGRYTISVTDAASTSGFIIQESNKAATTVSGIKFEGKRSVTLNLMVGQWFFYPSFVGKKVYFIVTAK